jgi:phage terminase large subunit-like protein
VSKPTTKPSTPRLSDLARKVVAPKGVVSTGWPGVEKKCAELGIRFRPWQPDVGRLILAKRADGKYAATIGGTGLSIPRQVGKTFLVGAIVFALCLLRPKLTVIWTAHRLRTAEETFGKMQVFAKRKRIAPHVLKLVLGSGEEEIQFRNGSRILFGARERGFGRGFDEVDVLIFDEAQILTENALDDMVPATNQSRQPSSALLLFMGTPPKPTDPGEVFTRMRKEALAGEDDDTGWVEFGADHDYKPTLPPAPLTDADWRQVAKANPSYPQDTPRESILRMRKKLGADSFLREGLGIWDDDDSGGAFAMGRWKELADPAAERGNGAVFGVHVTEDRDAWIAVAWWRDDGAAQVMLANDGQPVRAFVLVDECKRLASEWGGRVVPPRTFQDDLERAGVPLSPMKQGDFQIASGAFEDAFTAGTIRHGNQPALNTAVRVARMRAVGTAGEQVIQLKDAPEVGPLAAVVRALHGLQKRREVEPWAAYE